MGEPQEPNRVDKALEYHKQFAESVQGLGNQMPDDLKRQAQGKIDEFKAVKGEIYEDLQVVHERLEKAQKKIKENSWDEKTGKGVLTRAEKDYLECL